MQSPFITFASTNVEEMQEKISAGLGWRIRINPGLDAAFRGEVNLKTGSLFNLVHSRYSSAIAARGEVRPDNLSVVRVRRGRVKVCRSMGALVYDEGSVILVNTNHTDFMRFIDASECLYLTVPYPAVAAFASRLFGVGFAVRFDRHLLVDQASPVGAALARCADFLSQYRMLEPYGACSDYTCQLIQEAMLAAILDYLAHALGHAGAPLAACGKKYVLHAMDIIAATDRPLQVSEVAEAVGVTIRTLQLSFLDAFGMTPQAYIKRARLSAFRAETRARGRLSAKQTARHWGFANMSRLRADYIAVYGLDDWNATTRR